MIEILIFHLHIVGALYAFTKNWQRNSFKEGILALLVIGLIFTVGWALTGPIARLVMPDSANSVYFSQDTLSLILLFIPEFILFYHIILKDKPTQVEGD
ncbi:MAG: hypothetical protein PHV24_06765 [Candidatus Kapabacteria bacterium]|nr:hypothetical protein [Candidatus Kapabacteria bacterium]